MSGDIEIRNLSSRDLFSARRGIESQVFIISYLFVYRAATFLKTFLQAQQYYFKITLNRGANLWRMKV